VRIDEASELGDACPSSLAACEPSLAPACRLSCQPTAEGCANVWELHRLDVLQPNLNGQWLGFDSAGNHGLFVRFKQPTFECQILPSACGEPISIPEYFSWNPADGAQLLRSEPWLSIHDVSDDAAVAFGTSGSSSVYWTPTGGVQPMPIWNAGMARHGRLFAGELVAAPGAPRRGVRWVPGEDPLDVVEFDTLIAAQAGGDAVLFVTPSTIVYSPAAGERIDIGIPADAAPDANFNRAALAANGTRFAVVLQDAYEARLYSWADGSFERIELPANDAWLEPILVSDDGQVVVAGLEDALHERQHVRWSADTGTQLLSDDSTFRVEFMSSTGDLILGEGATPEGYSRTLHWSRGEGLREMPRTAIGGRVAFDGEVIVDRDDDGIVTRKSGAAVDVPLPIDHLQGRLPFVGPLGTRLELVSPNARMLGGSAVDDRGAEWLWLARLQTICPSAQ